MDENELNKKFKLTVDEYSNPDGTTDTSVFHTIDTDADETKTSEVSDIGLIATKGKLHISADSSSTAERADDEELSISIIDGILYQTYIIGKEDEDDEKIKRIKKIIESICTDSYRVFFNKSDGANRIPFDTINGFMCWDFDQGFLHFISINYDYAYTQTKYPLCINTISILDIVAIESYNNLKEYIEKEEP